MSPVGRSTRRFEDERLLKGEGRFVDDLRVEGCLEAVFVRSTVPHGTVRRVDAGAARARPGVVAILTGADLAAAGVRDMSCRRPIDSSDGTPFYQPTRPVMAQMRVRFAGEALAIVVAESLTAALDAAECVEVDIEPEPAVIDAGQSGLHAFTWEHGDAVAVEAAIARAAHVTRFAAVNNRIAPAPIEPRSAIASYEPETGSFDLVTQSQGVHLIRNVMADTLGLHADAIRVRTFDVGGSFGLKLVAHPELAALLAATRAAGRPVRWTSSRSEAFLADNDARDHVSEATLALDRDGNFLALSARTVCNLGAYASASAPACMSIHFMRTFGHVYRVPAHHVSATGSYTNTAPTDVMRGAGKPEAHALVERLIDRAAREHGFDRVELRRRNLIRPADLPRKTLSGHAIDGGDIPRTLEVALARADWQSFDKRRRQSTSHGRLRGIGLALYMHVTSHPVHEQCRVALDADGRISAAMGAQAIGQGHETTFAQLVAGEMMVPVGAVRIVQGDTRSLPPIGAATGGSGSLQTSGLTLVNAARALKDRLKYRAAGLLEASPGDLEHVEGGLRIKGTDRLLRYVELAGRLSAQERDDCSGAADFKGDAASCPNGAYVAEVEIDPATGQVAVLRFSGADDVGRRLNPMIVEGQLHGGLAQGISQALWEQVVYDPHSGQLLTGSLMDYVLPLASDFPGFDLTAADTPSSGNELGMKGVGECGTIGAPAAIMNAIADAIGHDKIEMPATSERVWRAIQLRSSP